MFSTQVLLTAKSDRDSEKQYSLYIFLPCFCSFRILKCQISVLMSLGACLVRSQTSTEHKERSP